MSEMTAPEKLWAWYDYDEDGWDNAYATTHDQIHHSTAYVRSDLHAALQAENERLREALQRIEAASKFWSEYPEGNDAIRYAHDSTHRLARAALK